MKAVDLYAGIGGWSLGLGMAGIEVVASYEWWPAANLTNSRNNRHPVHQVDIRSLDPSSVPSVDVVVGSPPCTHFSLANRGGKGNILEGLKDVEKFLEVIEAVRPRFWALENVPRLASIFQSEINQGGTLHRFAGLNPSVAVVDCSEWGVPQRRKRALIGNFDLDLMLSYRSSCRTIPLGCVISSLASDPAVDPVYGLCLPPSELTDHVREDALTEEEERINRDAKTNHPVYNGMSFPDDPSRPSRTVTATCTRVSRESIVVSDDGAFRRLTVRERASLQSFPITYQFYGETQSQKQKMVGNALPPLIAYYAAQAMLSTPAARLPVPAAAVSRFSPPAERPKATRPDKAGSKRQPQRRFRASIPGLRFKSGTRFELSNSFDAGRPEWRVRFFYGDSKRIREVELGDELLGAMRLTDGVGDCVALANMTVADLGGIAGCTDPLRLQRVWSHGEEEYAHPHRLVDSIGSAAAAFIERDGCALAAPCLKALVRSWGSPSGSKKLERNAREVFAGMIVGSVVNEMLKAGVAT